MGNNKSSLLPAQLTVTVTAAASPIISTTREISTSILQPAESISTIVVQTSVLELTTVVSISSVIITETPAAPAAAATAIPLISSSISSLQETTRELSSSSIIQQSASVTLPTSSAGAESSALMSQQSGGVARVSASGTALAAQETSPTGTFVTVDRTQPKVGPFSPEAAILGGIPTKDLDVPVTAVFLVLFLIGAVTHFTIHEINGKRGHKFHLSDMVFDFCMVRTVTCTMRIVWAFRPKNNSIVLAAEIFENAG